EEPAAEKSPARIHVAPVSPSSSSSSSGRDEVAIAKNDIDLESLRTDEEGYTYRKCRPPRIVSRAHPGIKDEAVLVKLKGLKTWERIDLLCSAHSHKEKP